MNNTIEEIKKKIDIIDFIGSYVSLKKAGRNFKACCPFHNEKTPSFVVSPDRQIWHCFGGCQDGGDIVRFLMKIEGLTFYEALKMLAEKAGIKLKNINFEDKEWNNKEKLLKINNAAAEYFHFLLKEHKLGDHCRKYLEDRKINSKIIDTFSLGYSPSSWDSLYSFLKKRKFLEEDILKTGLIIKKDNGGYYDRFRGRLMFPIKDTNSNIVSFSGRILDKTDDGAKYLNGPETEIYKKRETLFGINLTKDNIRKNGFAIITEGEFDMISCFKAGIDNVVAVKGSAVTYEQLKLLKRYCLKLVLALDGDFSGSETTKRAIIDAENLEFEITVLQIDFAKDPDEAINKDVVKFKQALKKPIPIYDFIINNAIKKYPENDAFSKKKMAEEVLPFLKFIKNPIVQSFYIKKISDIINIDVQAIEKMLKNQKINFIEKKVQPIISEGADRIEMLEKYLIGVIFQSEDPFLAYEKISTIFNIDDYTIPAYSKLVGALTDYHRHLKTSQNNVIFSTSQFASYISKELLDVYDKVILFDTAFFDKDLLDENYQKTAEELKKLVLKKKINELNEKIDDNPEDYQLMKDLTKQLSEVEKKRNIL